MRLSSSLIAITALTFGLSFATAGDLHDGENLLQPLPLPDGVWLATQAMQGRDEIVDWRKKDTNDRARTAILHRQGSYPVARFREINYKGGRESCAAFNGRIIDEAPINGYERNIWVGDCTQADGSSITALWLFISGKDSSYFLFRQWHGVPDAAAMDQWVAYFRSVKVCDTRARRKAPCASTQ